MFNWLKRLIGGSDSSSESAEPVTAPEPAAAPEPASMPSEQPSADAGTSADEPEGDEPA